LYVKLEFRAMTKSQRMRNGTARHDLVEETVELPGIFTDSVLDAR
jgi:hypothetical protein